MSTLFANRIGVFAKPNSPEAAKLIPQLIQWLKQRDLEVRLDNEAARYAGMFIGLDRTHVAEGCDLAVVLGGDGTVLSAARAIGNRQIPIFAVNLGALGFLTAIKIEDLFPELELALAGGHQLNRRKMMEVSLLRDQTVVAHYQCLNDAVIAKSNIARMIEVDALYGDTFVCSYRADGLIIATPTGSTAYSLSAGGPIIYPSVSAFCLTPICPHTLTNRPLIIPFDQPIRVINHADDEQAYLTIDGQVGSPLENGDIVECRPSNFDILLIRPPLKTFFDVLRTKLKWGER